MLNQFKFEVEPYSYSGTHGGTEKTYRISIEVDGMRHGIIEVAKDIPPTQSELEYLIRYAVETLSVIIKKGNGDDVRA